MSPAAVDWCDQCNHPGHDANESCGQLQLDGMSHCRCQSGELTEENERRQEAADARREAIEDPAIDPLDLKLEGDQGRLL